MESFVTKLEHAIDSARTQELPVAIDAAEVGMLYWYLVRQPGSIQNLQVQDWAVAHRKHLAELGPQNGVHHVSTESWTPDDPITEKLNAASSAAKAGQRATQSPNICGNVLGLDGVVVETDRAAHACTWNGVNIVVLAGDARELHRFLFT